MADFNFDEINYDNDVDLIKYIKDQVNFKDIDKFYKSNIDDFFFATVLSIIAKKKNEGFDYLKSKGVFRVFDNIDKSLDVISFIERLLNVKDLIDIDEEFLNAKVALKKIVLAIKKNINKYLDIALNYKEFAIPDIMAICAKHLYSHANEYGKKWKNCNYDSKNISFVEYCNGASIFIDYLCNNKDNFSSKMKHLYEDPNMDLEKCIVFFNKISLLKEYEAYVDYFNFDIKCSNDKIEFVYKDDTMWKSINSSYIISAFSKMNSAYYTKDFDSASINELYDKDVNDLLSRLIDFDFKSNLGYERYAFRISNVCGKLCKQNFLFKEEKALLDSLAKDMVVPEDYMYNMEIKNNVYTYDLIHFKKIFLLWHERIKRLEWKNEKVFMNTVAQRISRSDFDMLFQYLYDDFSKLNDILGMLDFNQNSVKDILYSPFVVIDDYIYFSPVIVANSFIERNAIWIAKFRASTDLDFQVINRRNEYVEYTLKQVCDSLNISCVTGNLNYSKDGRDGEIDAIIYDDDRMIFVECKSPTPSTNVFELKNIYFYLKKGAKQLDLSLKAFEDEKFSREKLEKWGIPYKKRKFFSLICNAQREFSGAKINGHPIRSIKELCNYLTTGSVIMCENEYVVKTNNNIFDALLEYIGDNGFINTMFDSLSEYKDIFHIKNYRIEMDKFALDQIKAVDTFSSKYKNLGNINVRIAEENTKK